MSSWSGMQSPKAADLVSTTRLARRRAFGEVPADAVQHAVRMPDGVLLATDVYQPKRHGRRPALLCRLPYDKCGEECFIPSIARWFVERGYAVVAQDVRGKVRSGGNLEPFKAEVVDGYHTVDWAARQPWCSGAVGMFGDSYYGFTQWAAASAGHPALRAIAPRATSADMGHALHRDGVFLLESTACWCLETWVDEGLYEYDGELDWNVRPLSEVVPVLLGGRRPVGLDDYAHGRIPASARVPVPAHVCALHLGGFWDFLLGGQLATWRHARALGRAPQPLLLDTTDHGWTALREPGEPYRDPAASASAMELFLDEYLRPVGEFFDRVLRGRGPEEAPVRWRLARGPSGWSRDERWPPTASLKREWALVPGSGSIDNELVPSRARASVTRGLSARWTHDPNTPVPSRVHPYFPLIDPPDEQDLHRRHDVCTFTTAPAPVPIDLAGPVQLDASFSSSAPSAHLIATLCDVFPDGRTHRILEGATALVGPWPRRVSLRLGDTAYRIREGHRLRLALSGSSFPRYILHPGTDENPWSARAGSPAEHRIELSGAGAAALSAHVIQARCEAAG
jgi:predicted acyl esterase